MSYTITDACVCCSACEEACPVAAIELGDAQFEIDSDSCVDCGACASQCPVDAINA